MLGRTPFYKVSLRCFNSVVCAENERDVVMLCLSRVERVHLPADADVLIPSHSGSATSRENILQLHVFT